MTLKEIFTIETNEQYKLSKVELVALKNVIAIARERLWLAEAYPKKPMMNLDFAEDLGGGAIETCKASIAVLIKAAHRYSEGAK